ncbi:TPA: ABC transporter ATP-binding protein [Streptococcus equi subsp. zooepidemicus]|uniref:ABC transporter ATP-binding protein n=3 Tax=Streptococcus equi subsp. zooepidemicus TaxID=40041 RepID=C0MGV2_STRS7|nr:ABC transporter ATP-binding protein [Streptococcus equi]KIS11803.1 ABC transporter ATP-binding protein [Streptococcus equi subsp. zooepidemicus Sz105]KIS16654.1 ABC transporter ATP-binding protein [Streptococcus equi subsp. zooepidemicus Sz4is]HEL1015769.1 ABC transporter ATP-binding protein [Streptococcus equi subsp. ruminatorum]KDE01892.1 ABC transporter ATP-binding protein [Streptococcus equi subsp. zooepidemicus SzS31A1]KIQ75317.1 3-dehydroquinate dehydratase [Streptococcus equi subsp. 
MIEFRHVSKLYGDKEALSDMSLTIKDGEIFGLIGHNGAGKTTTISILTSIIEASYGEVLVNGQLLSEHRNTIKRQIGYVPDSPDIFLNLTAYEYWQFLAKIYGVSEADTKARIEELTQLFELTQEMHNTIDNFSHGMRQKVIVIGALISNPSIWILDEPLTGLDPQASFDLKEMMKEHAASGNTVLFSTHVLSVAEQLCDRIGILKKGKLIFVGTVEQLKADYPDKDLETIYLELAGRQAQEA